MSGKKLADRLDWNAMLGFEQVVDSRESLGSDGSERLGAKVGGKPLVKPATGMGGKTGAKIGSKPGIKPTTIGTKSGIKPVMLGTKTGIKPVDSIWIKSGIKPVG
jgi:hypothetical protein